MKLYRVSFDFSINKMNTQSKLIDSKFSNHKEQTGTNFCNSNTHLCMDSSEICIHKVWLWLDLCLKVHSIGNTHNIFQFYNKQYCLNKIRLWYKNGISLQWIPCVNEHNIKVHCQCMSRLTKTNFSSFNHVWTKKLFIYPLFRSVKFQLHQ